MSRNIFYLGFAAACLTAAVTTTLYIVEHTDVSDAPLLIHSATVGKEAYWRDIIQKEIGGTKEYRLEDNTRVDLLLEDRACEIDWTIKWAEGIGQATYYGLKTSRPPLVILLAKKDGWEKYRDRVEFCGIECWVFDTRTGVWLDWFPRVKESGL